MLFSATLPPTLADFTLSGIWDYKLLKLDHEHRLSDDLKIDFFFCKSSEKIPALLYILNEIIGKEETTIIFAATKYHVEYLNSVLTSAWYEVTFVYGSLDMEARSDSLLKFRKKISKILIVTDLAARGLDIPFLNNVINFDFPPNLKTFIHWAGRTARAGQKGWSFTLLTPD